MSVCGRNGGTGAPATLETPVSGKVHRVLFPFVNGVERKHAVTPAKVADRDVPADLAFVVAVRTVIQAVAADLSEGTDAERFDVDAVFDSRSYAARFGIACAAVGARKPERREGVGSCHRIVGENAVQCERILPEEGKRAEGLRADPKEPQRIVDLARVTRRYYSRSVRRAARLYLQQSTRGRWTVATSKGQTRLRDQRRKPSPERTAR